MSDVFLKKALRQTAVYWAPLGYTESSGADAYDAPIEIQCRWSVKQQEAMDADGNVFVTNAVVMVDRDLLTMGVLWLGSFDDIPLIDQMLPFNSPGAWKIRGWSKVPNFRGNKFVRQAML